MDDFEFDRLLKITRIKLSEEERRSIKKDIEQILAYFDRINKMSTDEKPAYHPIKISPKLREDKVLPFKDREKLLRGTKRHESYVLGPKL